MRKLLLIVTLMIAGCNGKLVTEPVMGTVTYDGQPLADANISFSPTVQGVGAPAYAVTDAGGNYKLQTFLGEVDAGTTLGIYAVTVTKVDKSKKREVHDPGYLESGGTPKRPKALIPEKYGNAKTSGLTATVNKGKNVINFELNRKP